MVINGCFFFYILSGNQISADFEGWQFPALTSIWPPQGKRRPSVGPSVLLNLDHLDSSVRLYSALKDELIHFDGQRSTSLLIQCPSQTPTQKLTSVFREFHQIWHKRPLRLEVELTSTWWSKGHCDLHYRHDPRIHVPNKTISNKRVMFKQP